MCFPAFTVPHDNILLSHSSNSLHPSNTKINAHSALELSSTQQYSGIQAHSSLCLCPLPLLSSSVAYSTLPASFPVLPAWQAPCNRGVIGAAVAASTIEMSSPLLRFTYHLTKTMSWSYLRQNKKDKIRNYVLYIRRLKPVLRIFAL